MTKSSGRVSDTELQVLIEDYCFTSDSLLSQKQKLLLAALTELKERRAVKTVVVETFDDIARRLPTDVVGAKWLAEKTAVYLREKTL